MDFQQIGDHNTVVQKIIAEIRDSLIKGTLEPGDRLPSESKLIESFGVSRTAVREAMKILAAIGVVEIRRGDGTFITTDPTNKALDPLEFSLIINRGTSMDLLELRKTIDLGCCELVIEKADDADFELLSKLAGEYKELVETCAPIELILDKDLEIHKAYIQTTKNQPLIKVNQTVLVLFNKSMLHALSKPGVAIEGINQHMELVEAIKSGNIVRLRKSIEEHLSVWYSSGLDM